MRQFIHLEKHTLVASAVFLVLGIILGALMHKETIVVREGTAATPAAMSSVNLMLDYGDGGIHTWNTVSWTETMSVLGLLERVAAASAIRVTEKDLGSKNVTVGAIDNVANDAGAEMRWQYWVNNNYEPRIASKYFLKPGDIVLWKYVKEQPK